MAGVDVCAVHRVAPRRRGTHCPICAGELAAGIALGQRCAPCTRRLPRFRQTLVAVDYGAPGVRDWALAFKHAGRRDLALPLARAMASSFGGPSNGALDGEGDGGRPGPRDLLVPVPLHAGRLRERGYNQAALLAQGLAQAGLGVPLPILARVRPTAAQGDPSAPARRKNVAAAFRALAKAPTGQADRLVWIVDDVVTTGSTADACARTLWSAGFRRIGVLAFARA